MFMLTLNEIQKTNKITSLRRIAKNENLSFALHLHDFLCTQKYGNEVDYDVYLPTKGFNLQREYVWTQLQQEEFIWSLIYERSIPQVVFICHETDEEINGKAFNKQIWEVIDGKQRLMTLKRFFENKFSIHFEGKEYYWNDLDKDIRFKITYSSKLTYTVYYSYYDEPISDDEKIIIFNFYNFAGTPQEESHREKLQNALSL